ncbi:MAG: DUF551 domain-containing protein [bacterium]|jgi:hypothetical protein
MNWQPIDTAPKDGSEVILWHADYMAFGYHSPKGWMVTNNGDYLDGGHGNDYLCNTKKYASYQPPTHWMPLPEPPKETP